MAKYFLLLAAALGAFSVTLGAFGAHALKKLVPDSVSLIFETAVRYQFYHVFALLAVGLLLRNGDNKLLVSSGYLFLLGILLFSGSLYLLTWFKGTEKTHLYWVGAITPIGGLLLIAGWLCLFAAIYKST